MKSISLFVAASTIMLVFNSGCTSTHVMSYKDGSYDYYALKDALGLFLNKPVRLHVGDIQIECTPTGLESDRLIIRQGDRIQEIPIRAISRMELDEIGRSLMATGGVSAAGAALGWIAGRLISSEVLASEWKKFKKNDEQMAAAVAGATVGFLAGAWIGSRKAGKVMEINPNVETIVLDRAVGKGITETMRQQYGLFDDLPLQPTESVASIQVVQYGPTDYLVFYTSFEQPQLPAYAYDGREVTLKIPAAQIKLSWMGATRDYLVKEQDKIHQKLNTTEQGLKYRLFEQ